MVFSGIESDHGGFSNLDDMIVIGSQAGTADSYLELSPLLREPTRRQALDRFDDDI